MSSTPAVSLKQLAIKGVSWTVVGYGSGQIIRLLGNLILTRLLYPELFGLMGLVQIFITGLNLFSDIGINPSIVRNKRGDEPVFLNTAWTLQVIRGFGLWMCCFLIAWPVAHFYGEPRLQWLIPIVGINSVVAGFNSTTLATLSRHMALGKLTILQIVLQICTISVMIVCAWINPSIWALVIGNFASSFLNMVISHLLIPGFRNKFVWNREVLNEIYSFGRWIFISTIFTFLAGQCDRLLLGKLFPLDVLGIYTVAFMLSEVPRQLISMINGKVFFPIAAKLIELPRREFRDKILRNRPLLLLPSALVLALMSCFGDLIISILYDERYASGGWMLSVMALGIWPRLAAQTIDPALTALGKPFYVALGNCLKLIFMVIAMPIGFHYLGIFGAILVITLNDVPYYGAIAYGLQREKLSSYLQDLKMTFAFGVIIAVFLSLRFALNLGLPYIPA